MNGASMAERVAAYLGARRALGFALQIEGQQLERFACFADAQGHHGPLTLDLALAWANAPKNPSAIGPARRLELLRPFARYCALFEPETAVPPSHLLGPAHRRVAPHIYSAQEVADLLDAAGQLGPPDGLRPITVRCLLGLLAATGLRVSEALHLTCAEVDLIEGVLTIRETKFRKSRYVPLHPTTQAALADYVESRRHRVAWPQDPAFFLFDEGRGVRYGQIHYAFACLRERLGWDRRPAGGPLPRLYDLRHTFACRRLLAWYAEGVDVHWAIPHLATYLGHRKVSDTYWYLTGIPELMAVAAERFERLAATGTEEGQP
jgi:integrase